MTTSRIIATAVAVLLLAACGSDDDSSDEGAATTTSSDTTTPRHRNRGRGANDRHRGRPGAVRRVSWRGSPTILLEAGDESGHDDWRAVVAGLGAETRTCAYDRLGTGRSSPAEGCRGIDEIIGDLEALLDQVDRRPIPLRGRLRRGLPRRRDGHPAPGRHRRPRARRDAPGHRGHPAGGRPLLPCDAPNNIERRDYVAVEHAVWDDKAEIGAFPVVVSATTARTQPTSRPRGRLVLSPDAEQVVVDSGHDVPINEPDLVVEKILEVLDTARAG